MVALKRASIALVFLLASLCVARAQSTRDFVFRPIDFPNSTETGVLGINDCGHMVGYYLDANRIEHGFVLKKETFTTFDPPNVPSSVAADINNSDQIVGGADLSNGFAAHGYLYSGGVFTQLDFPGAFGGTVAVGINNTSQIVGAWIASNEFGFIYDGTSFTSIVAPPGLCNNASGINTTGHIVGSTCQGHGFLFNGSGFTLIDFPGATTTETYRINGQDDIVGFYRTSGPNHAFLLSQGIFRSFDYPAATGTNAYGLNNVGQVVGGYQDTAGVVHGYVVKTRQLSVLPPKTCRE